MDHILHSNSMFDPLKLFLLDVLTAMSSKFDEIWNKRAVL